MRRHERSHTIRSIAIHFQPISHYTLYEFAAMQNIRTDEISFKLYFAFADC